MVHSNPPIRPLYTRPPARPLTRVRSGRINNTRGQTWRLYLFLFANDRHFCASGSCPIIGTRYKKIGEEPSYDLCEADYQALAPEEQAQYQSIERFFPPNFVSLLPRDEILTAMASADASGGHADDYNFPERGFQDGSIEFNGMWSFASSVAAYHLPIGSLGMVVIARTQTLREARLLEHRLVAHHLASFQVHVHGPLAGMAPTQQVTAVRHNSGSYSHRCAASALALAGNPRLVPSTRKSRLSLYPSRAHAAYMTIADTCRSAR